MNVIKYIFLILFIIIEVRLLGSKCKCKYVKLYIFKIILFCIYIYIIIKITMLYYILETSRTYITELYSRDKIGQ